MIGLPGARVGTTTPGSRSGNLGGCLRRHMAEQGDGQAHNHKVA